MYTASPRHIRQLRAVALSPPSASGVALCTLLLRAASGESGLPRSTSDTYRPTSHDTPCSFCWPSRRRKTYFNQVKTHATRSDGGSKQCDTYRRWCSDHLCCIAHKKNLKRRFSGQIHDWKHLYLRFFYVRRSVIPP